MVQYGPLAPEEELDQDLLHEQREDVRAQGHIQLLPPHELPRELALRDAGAADPSDWPSPCSRQMNEEAHVYSSVWPHSPPPAQPRRVARPFRDEQAVTGHLYAAENAIVMQLVEDAELQKLPKFPLSWAPRGIRFWGDVEVIYINGPVYPRCLHPLDLRNGPWEVRQAERYIPILRRGMVSGTVVVSKETSLSSVQHRLDITCIADKHWRVMALTHEEWCIVATSLPQDIAEDLEELQELREQQRGGMKADNDREEPIAYRLAHRPTSIYHYQPEGPGEVIAEMVCYIADRNGQSTDDVILITHDHVPFLHERLDSFPPASLHVVFLAYLYHPHMIGSWMWSPFSLTQAANMQRGLRTDPPYDGTRRPSVFPPRPVNLPLTFQTSEYEEDGQSGCGKLQRQQRGGAKKIPQDKERDPKQRMISWANDKVQEHAPQVMGPTLNMLMRAETRTVTALLNSKNQHQTKEIITAAYRRAGLDPPFGAPKQSSSQLSSAFETDFIKAMTNQAIITQQIAEALSEIPKKEKHDMMDKFMRDTQESYITAVKSLSEAIQKLEQRIESWETTFLPQLIDRLPDKPPPSPASDTSSTHRQSGDSKRHSNERSQPYSGRGMVRHEHGHGQAQQDVSALDKLREISLRNCCERLMSSQKQQQEVTCVEENVAQEAPTSPHQVVAQAPTALKPFRSTH